MPPNHVRANPRKRRIGAFTQKASQKQEYRWEDFRKEEPPPIAYEPVKDFDSRFFYYDQYSVILESVLHSTSRSAEEEKCMQWAITEEDLEPGLALDPTSYAAKAMQRKRKEPPTESEALSSVRKRPTTPPLRKELVLDLQSLARYVKRH